MIHVATISQAAIASCLRAGGCSLRFVGLAEDEFRIDAEDALGAIEGLEVRRVFSGWGFYRRGLLFAAAWEGDFASVLGRPVTGYMRLLTESCWAAPRACQRYARDPRARLAVRGQARVVHRAP